VNGPLVCIGLSHRTAPLEVRELLVLPEDAQVAFLQGHAQAPVEALLLSTCNRVELYLAGAAEEALHAARRALCSTAGRDLDGHLYRHEGEAALRHLFRVSASLDSMVVGEPQILGQLKQFYARAASVGATGAILHRWFHKAFSVAKRVRSETGIAGRAVSTSSAAVELAATIFDHFEDKTAMLIGAGKMGTLAARHLLGNGVGRLMITNRTFDRAVELARDFNATPVPFEQFATYLPMADIVIGSVST